MLDAETVPFIDVTAVNMLIETANDLQREGVQLALARDIGQVRDILGRSDMETGAILTYPTVPAAVQALTA